MHSRFATAGGAGAGADRRPPLPLAGRPSRDHFPGDPTRIELLENSTLEDEVRRELQIERRARADRSKLERLSGFSHDSDFRFGESLLPTAVIHRFEDVRYSTRYSDARVREELGSVPLPNYKPSFTSSYYEAEAGESVHPPVGYCNELGPVEWPLRQLGHHAEIGLPRSLPVSSGPKPLLVEETIKPRPKRKFQFRDCDAITLTLGPSLNIPGANRKSDETVVSTATETIMVAPTNVLREPAGENSFSMVSTTSQQDSELRFQGNKCLDTSKANDQILTSTSLAEDSSHDAKEVDKLLPADEAKELDQPPTLNEVSDVKIAPGERQKMLFFCHLCRVNCWGQDGLESHLNGRYHQARLREKGFKEHCKGKKHKIKEERVTVEISLLSDSVPSAPLAKQSLKAKEVDQPRKAKDVHDKKTTPGKKPFLLFSCHICSVNCLGQAGLDNHLKGRKHQEALRQPKNDKHA